VNTKKDYERAAMIVRGYPPTGVSDVVCDAFVMFFRGDNPRFDGDRFRAACKGGAVRRNRRSPRRRSVRRRSRR
jgi:hypothetical protein